MIETLRQLLIILDGRTRLRFALLFIPMTLMTVLEVVSIGLVIPVVQVLVMGEQNGYLTELLVSLLPMESSISVGPWVTGLFALFFVIKNFCLLALIFIVNRFVAYESAIYAQRLFTIYLSEPLHFHFQINSATLLLNITQGVNRSLETVRLILLIVLDAMLMVGAFGLLVFANPLVTLGAAAVLVVIGLVFYAISSPIFRRWGEVSLKIERNLIKWINQSFSSIRDVKILQAQNFLRTIISEITNQRAHYLCLSTTSVHIPRLLIETIVVIGFLGIVLMLTSTNQDPAQVVSVLGLFGMAALRLMPSMNRILTSASEVRRSAAFIGQIYNAFKPQESKIGERRDFAEESVPLTFESKIELRDVSYSYQDQEHHALKEINLEISKGTSVGFVGASGAGKSTLMDIILGLLEPTSGALRIDNISVGRNVKGWQRHLGFVPQHVSIMDDTLRRNIAFATDDDEIDDGRIEDVIKMTQLAEFVSSLPEGLDTLLGEQGTRLSGGQRQRTAIARALYRDPDVLVFDEATSALDNVTEREITRAIETLTGEKTILIVAHRLSTVRACDKIVFMKDGLIVDVGEYDELLKRNVDFRHLAEVGNIDVNISQDV